MIAPLCGSDAHGASGSGRSTSAGNSLFGTRWSDLFRALGELKNDTGGGDVTVQNSGAEVSDAATVLNFNDNLTATEAADGSVTIDGAGDSGLAGEDGWSPELAVASNGARRVLQIDDWAGGGGAKPTTGEYVGASGLVAAVADGVDIRGPAGTDGVAGAAGATGPAGAAGMAGATGATGADGCHRGDGYSRDGRSRRHGRSRRDRWR